VSLANFFSQSTLMTTHSSRSRPRPALRHVLGLLTFVCAANMAVGQGTGNTQLDDMRRQIDGLRRRTDSLQKRSDSLAKALNEFIVEHTGEHAAADKSEQVKAVREQSEARALDKRLEAMEARLAENSREATPNKPTSTASTVRAPFVVQDANGAVILRVTGGRSPRLVVGNENAGHVELGTGNAGGGIVAARDNSGKLRAQMIASDGFGQVRMSSSAHSAILTSGDEDGAVLSLFYGDSPRARVKAGQSGYGSWYLYDAAGKEMVSAGILVGNKGPYGQVWTGPRTRPSFPQPSVVQGVP
jgi:hypothetical protein